MISAISFVPIADTIAAFHELCNHAGNQEQAILDYFEINYIGELRRGRRLQPRFPHATWMNGRVQDDVPRTNNDLDTTDSLGHSLTATQIFGSLLAL